MVLNETYDFLKNAGIVSSEAEFSEDWLGHSECYLRTLRFKNADPGIGSIAICASRLQKAGEQMLSTAHYRQLGMSFISMSEKCHRIVNERSVQLEFG
jgi:hypothetical protein